MVVEAVRFYADKTITRCGHHEDWAQIKGPASLTGRGEELRPQCSCTPRYSIVVTKGPMQIAPSKYVVVRGNATGRVGSCMQHVLQTARIGTKELEVLGRFYDILPPLWSK
jgi:hypothetical protein